MINLSTPPGLYPISTIGQLAKRGIAKMPWSRPLPLRLALPTEQREAESEGVGGVAHPGRMAGAAEGIVVRRVIVEVEAGLETSPPPGLGQQGQQQQCHNTSNASNRGSRRRGSDDVSLLAKSLRNVVLTLGKVMKLSMVPDHMKTENEIENEKSILHNSRSTLL